MLALGLATTASLLLLSSLATGFGRTVESGLESPVDTRRNGNSHIPNVDGLIANRLYGNHVLGRFNECFQFSRRLTQKTQFLSNLNITGLLYEDCITRFNIGHLYINYK